MRLGGGKGGLKAWPEGLKVSASAMETDPEAEVWNVLPAPQAVLRLSVTAGDAGDKGVTKVSLGGRGPNTVGWATVPDKVIEVTSDGIGTVSKQEIVNVTPFAQLTVLKVENGNANEVNVQVELAYVD